MSFQSTLGDGVAEELAESQRAISIAEFFEKNKQMLGFDSEARALVTAVKEAVDNALDAAEEARIRPNIEVEIEEAGDYYRLIVEDNGPGITREQIPNIFGKLLYGSRFHAREQSRGQQGIGISATVLYAQLTSGKPARIVSRTKGADMAQEFELIIDTDTNEPEIRSERELAPADSPLRNNHGTRIEVEMEGNMRARQQLHDYIRHTAVVNPHATISFSEPDAKFTAEAEYDAELPEETEEIRPHPHGVELGNVLKMLDATESHSLSGFLQTEFTRVGKKTADSIVDSFRDRHYGREMAWTMPDEDELRAAVADAVNNKSADATDDFSDQVCAALDARKVDSRLTHADVVDAAATAAEGVDTATFGSTVRENAVDAVWAAVRDDPQSRTSDVHSLVDRVTTARKDEDAVRGLADRLAEKLLAEEGGPKRLTHEALQEQVGRAADMTESRTGGSFGETARENVVDAVWETMKTVPDDPPKVRDVADDRDVTAAFVEAMRETDIMAPPTSCLAPISADLVETGLRRQFDAEFYSAATRDAEVHAGDPFVVEAGIAYGGEIDPEGEADILRFANRVPLVYKRGGCAITQVVQDIGWRNYELDQPGGTGVPKGPAVVMVHVASTNVPFTSESKDAVAGVPEIEDEIELAVREAARELKSYLKEQRSMEKRQRKQNVLGEILPLMATKVSDVTDRQEPDIDDALARIMNNVLVEREMETDGDEQTVTLAVENNGSSSETVEVTDVLPAEPRDVSADATVVEMDGEWFLSWEPTVGGDERVTVSYTLPADADLDTVTVKGLNDAKLTNDTGGD